MIDYSHPAVEALADAIYRALSSQYGDFGTPSKREAHSALTAALPHLTADDLRNTPAGRALMAEAWEEGVQQFAQFGDVDTNPYKETPNE